MIRKVMIIPLGALFVVSHFSLYAQRSMETVLEELRPEIFLADNVSTGDFEYGSALSKDGATFVFIKGIQGFQKASLVVIRKEANNQWGVPSLLPFSGVWYDTNPYFSYDSKKLFFVSDRPTEDTTLKYRNMWYVHVGPTGFSQPRLLQGFNDRNDVIYPTVDKEETVRYCSVRPEGKGGLDLYRVGLEEGKYGAHIPITELNTPFHDADPEVSPNGQLMVFTSTREGGLGDFDLYITKKNNNGRWEPPVNLRSLNSPAMDSDPIFSKDGKYLFFSSNRYNSKKAVVEDYQQLKATLNGYNNGLMNIYYTDVSSLLKQFDTKG